MIPVSKTTTETPDALRDALRSLPLPGRQTVKSFLPGCKHCDGTGHIPHPLLSHLRSAGPHYRGCWALDLILGRE